MPYELTFIEKDGFLHVVVRSQTIDRDSACSYLSKVAEKCDSDGYTRVLIERDIPVMLPFADLFLTTEYFLGLMKGRRVAFVNSHSSNGEDMNLAIMIGTNRGASYELFSDSESAMEWLLK